MNCIKTLHIYCLKPALSSNSVITSSFVFSVLPGQINPLAAHTLLWVRGIWLIGIEHISILVLINLASAQILLQMKDARLAKVYNTFLWFVLNLHVYFYEKMLQKIPMNALA